METGWGFVDEILPILKPEAPEAREAEAAAGVSDTDYAIYSEKLSIICEEAKEVFVRSGRTAMLLAGDLVVGICTAAGDLATTMAGSYIHAVTAGPPIKYILGRWKDDPSVGIKEGDYFFNNDPLFGSLHGVDETVMVPIFSDGEIIAWAAAAVHQAEIGAISPGLPANAKSRFDEGLKVLPMKIGENYQLRQDILAMMANMTRTPEMHETDIRARAAACDRVRARVQALAKQKGNDFVMGLLRRMLMAAENGARYRIRKWNDGRYRCVVFSDSVGFNKEGLQKVGLTVTKEDDRCVLDFTECSPETDGPRNSFPHAAIAHAVNVLYWGPFCDLPTSAGLFGALEFKFKPGTVLNASRWASTMVCPSFLVTVMVAVQICFAKMMYGVKEDRELIISGTGGLGSMTFAAVNQWGIQVADGHTVLTNEMGGGAGCGHDGVHSFLFAHCPWGKAMEIEDMEIEVPFLNLYASHLVDSGGFGRYRGGSGVDVALMTHLVEQGSIGGNGTGSRIPMTPGLFGGYPAPTAPLIKITESNAEAQMRSGKVALPRDAYELLSDKAIEGKYEICPKTQVTSPFSRGGLLQQARPGGGGYGDVLERDPRGVIKDLRDRTTSPWAAQNVYKVAYDPVTLEVDDHKTRELRQQEREARKQRGKRYDEFEKEWLAKRPPEQALGFYGSWPDANPTRVISRS